MPVNDISDLEPQLANCRDYWLGWAAADRVDGDLTYYRSGLAHSQLNGVLRLQSGRQVSDAINRPPPAWPACPGGGGWDRTAPPASRRPS